VDSEPTQNNSHEVRISRFATTAVDLAWPRLSTNHLISFIFLFLESREHVGFDTLVSPVDSPCPPSGHFTIETGEAAHLLPSLLARRRLARTRSCIIAPPNSANTPIIWKHRSESGPAMVWSTFGLTFGLLRPH
jgi:hypothetical protein